MYSPFSETLTLPVFADEPDEADAEALEDAFEELDAALDALEDVLAELADELFELAEEVVADPDELDCEDVPESALSEDDALAAVLAGRKLIRDRKHGGCACCGDCASCGRGCVTGFG